MLWRGFDRGPGLCYTQSCLSRKGEGVKKVDDRRGLGRYGEDLAARHLMGKGYEILARNWRCTTGEVDLVAQDGD